jgi:hypothetical protein
MAGTPRILVVVEGGVVQAVVSDTPELDCEVVVIDYDADEDANALIRQPDGSVGRAWVSTWHPAAAEIEIASLEEDPA